ncbi:hypothetical protein ACFLZ6_02240 [Nanoarchaeota archaeon]
MGDQVEPVQIMRDQRYVDLVHSRQFAVHRDTSQVTRDKYADFGSQKPVFLHPDDHKSVGVPNEMFLNPFYGIESATQKRFQLDSPVLTTIASSAPAEPKPTPNVEEGVIKIGHATLYASRETIADLVVEYGVSSDSKLYMGALNGVSAEVYSQVAQRFMVDESLGDLIDAAGDNNPMLAYALSRVDAQLFFSVLYSSLDI